MSAEQRSKTGQQTSLFLGPHLLPLSFLRDIHTHCLHKQPKYPQMQVVRLPGFKGEQPGGLGSFGPAAEGPRPTFLHQLQDEDALNQCLLAP